MARRNAYNRLSPYHTTIGPNSVTYHSTVIVQWTDDEIILQTGGFKSATTKKKMNQASNQFGLGFSVFQKEHEWFYTNPQGETWPFDLDSVSFLRR